MATFNELVNKLIDAEEGLVEMDDFEKLVGEINDKVDSLYYVDSKMEAEEGRLGKVVAQLTARKNAVASSRRRLRAYVVHVMEDKDIPYLEGDLYSIKLRESEKCDIPAMTISPILYAEIMAEFPTVMERKYSWKKNEVKKILKQKPDCRLSHFASIVKSKNPQFKPLRKEVEK